jgi:hypothetical protein
MGLWEESADIHQGKEGLRGAPGESGGPGA